MLIGIQGGLGTGKTILLVRYLLNDFNKGYTIFSNFHLENIEYTLFDVDKFLENEKKNKALTNMTIGVDELTVFTDCRLSMSKRNLLFSYLVLQSRKRSVDIYYTTQNFNMIDKRIISHTHIKVLCESIFNVQGKEIPHYKKYAVIDMRNPMNMQIKRFVLDIRPYYEFYDTDEIILPPKQQNQ